MVMLDNVEGLTRLTEVRRLKDLHAANICFFLDAFTPLKTTGSYFLFAIFSKLRGEFHEQQREMPSAHSTY